MSNKTEETGTVKELTPWQSFFEKEYLSQHNFDHGERLNVVISKAYGKQIENPKNPKGKKENLPVIEFEKIEGREQLKPMIVKTGNAKVIQKLSGTRHIENWSGVRLTLYVDESVKFGKDTVGGIRVLLASDVRPQKDQLHKNHPKWQSCILAIRSNGYTIEDIRKKYNVSAATEKLLNKAVENAELAQ